MNSLFMEICIAPDYSAEALEILKCKKNRILLKRKACEQSPLQFRSALNGVLVQEQDNKTEKVEELSSITSTALTDKQKEDLIFANKIVKTYKIKRELYLQKIYNFVRAEQVKHQELMLYVKQLKKQRVSTLICKEHRWSDIFLPIP